CGRDVLVITALLQPPELSSFPTRRSSDLESTMLAINASMALAEYDTDGKITKVNTHYLEMMGYNQEEVVGEHQRIFATKEEKMRDRKSTRLNSSHVKMSYAVFCLKKKKHD